MATPNSQSCSGCFLQQTVQKQKLDDSIYNNKKQKESHLRSQNLQMFGIYTTQRINRLSQLSSIYFPSIDFSLQHYSRLHSGCVKEL